MRRCIFLCCLFAASGAGCHAGDPRLASTSRIPASIGHSPEDSAYPPAKSLGALKISVPEWAELIPTTHVLCDGKSGSVDQDRFDAIAETLTLAGLLKPTGAATMYAFPLKVDTLESIAMACGPSETLFAIDDVGIKPELVIALGEPLSKDAATGHTTLDLFAVAEKTGYTMWAHVEVDRQAGETKVVHGELGVSNLQRYLPASIGEARATRSASGATPELFLTETSATGAPHGIFIAGVPGRHDLAISRFVVE